MGEIKAQQELVRLDNGIELNTFCWNPQDSDKPPALLTHGTGFVAATFNPLARQLVSDFCVYAYDRRGHGLSGKPECDYQLVDFAEDCQLFCQKMGFQSVYGIGHSAGATDLLIAESWQPGLFSKLFVMEPTINDPTAKKLNGETAFAAIQGRIEQAKKRRAQFDSKQQVYALYKTKPLFQQWQDDILKAYIDYGFKALDDGSVSLQCDPGIEAEVLTDIFLTFSNAEPLGNKQKPFSQIKNVKCPIAVSHSEHSGPQFRELARRACLHFPWAKSVAFKGIGHCVPQEDPMALAQEVIRFWQTEQ